MEIKIKNFRTIENLEINSNSKDKIYLFGKNGSGKTSVLEAFNILFNHRNFRSRKNIELLKNGENFYEVDVNLNDFNYSAFYEVNKNNLVISKNSKKVTSKQIQTEIISLFVHSKLINEILYTKFKRVDFFDRLISIIDPSFEQLLKELKKNKKILSEIFENMKAENISDVNFFKNKIDSLEKTLVYKRNHYISVLNDSIKNFNLEHNINFNIKLDYNLNDYSNTNDIISDNFVDSINKKDYQIFFEYKNIFNYSSEGTQRMIILLIIFAFFEHINNFLSTKGILLLDDILSHLDKTNQEIIINLVSELSISAIITNQKQIINENSAFYIKELR